MAEDNPRSAYVSLRLVRVRKQLDLLDRRIAELSAADVPDGRAINWLVTAQARLCEQERQLADRLLPGSKRRAPEKSTQGRSASLLLGSASESVQGHVEQE